MYVHIFQVRYQRDDLRYHNFVTHMENFNM